MLIITPAWPPKTLPFVTIIRGIEVEIVVSVQHAPQHCGQVTLNWLLIYSGKALQHIFEACNIKPDHWPELPLSLCTEAEGKKWCYKPSFWDRYASVLHNTACCLYHFKSRRVFIAWPFGVLRKPLRAIALVETVAKMWVCREYAVYHSVTVTLCCKCAVFNLPRETYCKVKARGEINPVSSCTQKHILASSFNLFCCCCCIHREQLSPMFVSYVLWERENSGSGFFSTACTGSSHGYSRTYRVEWVRCIHWADL